METLARLGRRMRLLDHLPDSLPFVAAATGAAPIRLSAQRIIEAVIIGLISAAGSTYVTVRVLDERVQHITQRIDRIEYDADRRVQSIQEDVRRIYALMVAARPEGRTGR